MDGFEDYRVDGVTESTTVGDFIDLDESYIRLLMTYLQDQERLNGTIDFTKPYIKASLRYVYPLFIFIHACIVVFGTCGNVAILVVIIKGRLYKNPTFFFIGNLAMSDILKASVVLPLTITNLLMQNWILGSFLCFFLPMLHSFPIHGSMLTYIVLAVDRYRYIARPMRSRVPAGLCAILIWVIAVSIVLPYAVYIKYIDVGAIIGPEFEGVGICWLNLERHIEEYIRGMFVTMYCLPLAVITFLYVKVSVELKSCDSSTVEVHIDEISQSLNDHSTCTMSLQRHESSEPEDTYRIGPEGASADSPPSQHTTHNIYPGYQPRRRRRRSSLDEDELNVREEKRTQKYLITMVTLFAMCWCPLNILILVTHFVYESEDNSGHFDITYLTFVFFGFLSTCINPVLFASWHMSPRMKDRLKGYFRFSNRRGSVGHSQMRRNTEDSELYSSRNTPSSLVIPKQNGHVYDGMIESANSSHDSNKLQPGNTLTVTRDVNPRPGTHRAARSHSARHHRRHSQPHEERDRRHSSGTSALGNGGTTVSHESGHKRESRNTHLSVDRVKR